MRGDGFVGRVDAESDGVFVVGQAAGDEPGAVSLRPGILPVVPKSTYQLMNSGRQKVTSLVGARNSGMRW